MVIVLVDEIIWALVVDIATIAKQFLFSSEWLMILLGKITPAFFVDPTRFFPPQLFRLRLSKAEMVFAQALQKVCKSSHDCPVIILIIQRQQKQLQTCCLEFINNPDHRGQSPSLCIPLEQTAINAWV